MDISVYILCSLTFLLSLEKGKDVVIKFMKEY